MCTQKSRKSITDETSIINWMCNEMLVGEPHNTFKMTVCKIINSVYLFVCALLQMECMCIMLVSNQKKEKKESEQANIKVQPSFPMYVCVCVYLHICVCRPLSHNNSPTVKWKTENEKEEQAERRKIEHLTCKKFYCLQHLPHFLYSELLWMP